ncbi:MAG: flagellar hook-basal body complex protein FliE [Mariprofundus sp.]|nr:flagellar hook-basal body complex protein FliE [Mariprofundus sp.]
MNIHGYQSTPSTTAAFPTAGKSDVGASAKPGGFGALLQAYTEQVNHDVKAGAKGAEALALGDSRNTSETLLAIKKADLSFQMMLSVRNKLVDAYREVIRMQV